MPYLKRTLHPRIGDGTGLIEGMTNSAQRLSQEMARVLAQVTAGVEDVALDTRSTSRDLTPTVELRRARRSQFPFAVISRNS